MMTPMIRKAHPLDLDSIANLWGAMMAEHERNDPRIRLAEGAVGAYRAYAGFHITSSDSCVRVADEGGIVVGYCLVSICRNLPMFEPPRFGYLSDLMVAAERRRSGLGRALVGSCAEWLRERKIESVQLQYYSFNAQGAAFWREMGFAPYYTRMWLDLA